MKSVRLEICYWRFKPKRKFNKVLKILLNKLIKQLNIANITKKFKKIKHLLAVLKF